MRADSEIFNPEPGSFNPLRALILLGQLRTLDKARWLVQTAAVPSADF